MGQKKPEMKREESAACDRQLPVRRRGVRILAATFALVGSGRPRREAADGGALTRRRAAAADGANEAVGSLAAN